MAVTPPGCRFPSACFSQACGCNDADLGAKACTLPCLDTDGGIFDGGVCASCPNGGVCVEEQLLCVGRGATCPGENARCLPFGETCNMSDGVPPQLIGDTDGGTTPEPHCQYVTDVCCPGTIEDLSATVVDLSASVADMATSD